MQPNVKGRSIPSRWYRANLWVHRWVSLFAVLPFGILCVTGLLLIFHEEIEHFTGGLPKPEQVAGVTERSMMDSVVVAQSSYPGERVMSTTLDSEHFPGLLLMGLFGDGGDFRSARWLFADIAQATLVDPSALDEGFMDVLLELHAQWFLGPVGELLGAFLALLVLLSLISGVVVYSPYLKKFLFGIVRSGKGKRLFQLDLHNLIGSAVLGWAFVVTFTGLLLGFGTLAIGVWQLTALEGLRQKYQEVAFPQQPMAPDIDQVYVVAAMAAEGWNPTTVLFPGSEYSTEHHYLVLLQGTRGGDRNMLKLALVDAHAFELAEVITLPLYLKAILLSQPLHYGDYGGLPLKLLWALCTLMTLFITLNGAWLWWARRRKIR